MKKFFLTLILTVITLSCFTFSGCKKENKLDEVSANLSNYSIDINFDAENKTATVSQTVDYINNSSSALKNVCFHLYPQFFKEGATSYIVPNNRMNEAYPNGMGYAEFNIQRVIVDGQDSLINLTNEVDSILDVQLASTLLPEDRVEIKIEYSFTLPNCEHRFGYGDNTINLANFYPIACVYEGGGFNCSPYNANGDPFYSDMANYVVNITIDSKYLVASTGKSVSVTNSGENTTHSFSAQAVRDFAFVLSDKFEVISTKVDNVTIEYFYFDDPHPQDSLNAGADAIETFSSLFGEYPYSHFTIVKTDFIQGGMEYPNLIMISSKVEDKDDYLNVIVHESAHQWWYGLVGNDEYKYPWLDEALTEYSTILFYDHNDGYNLTHAQMIEVNRSNYSLFITVYEDVLGPIDTSMRAVNEYDTEPEYTYCTYVKGTLMFESLYTLIGEKDFLSALKNYYENNAYSNATPEDLITAFSNETKKDLSNFFSSWLTGKVVIK